MIGVAKSYVRSLETKDIDKPYDFMGVPVHALTFQATCDRFRQAIQTKTTLVHTVINAHKILMARQSPQLLQAIERATLVNADGQSIVWFGRLSGIPIPERVTGIDLMDALLQIAQEEAASVYLLGATQTIVDTAMLRIQHRYPSISRIAGRNGYFRADEEATVCQEIGRFRPDILLLGMSSPKKEVFADVHAAEIGASIIMGVGGSFDIWADKTRRAPRLWQKAGLEWFYRFLQEPRRMWRRYLIGNMRFVGLWVRWTWTQSKTPYHPNNKGG